MLAHNYKLCGGAMGDEFANMSIWHWIVTIILWWLLFGWPCAKVLKRAGFSGWWTILSLIPFANIIGLWIFATTRWPRSPDK